MKIKEDFEYRHCKFLKYSSTKYAFLPNQILNILELTSNYLY